MVLFSHQGNRAYTSMLETVRYPRHETGQIPLNFTFLAIVPMYMEYHFVSDAASRIHSVTTHPPAHMWRFARIHARFNKKVAITRVEAEPADNFKKPRYMELNCNHFEASGNPAHWRTTRATST